MATYSTFFSSGLLAAPKYTSYTPNSSSNSPSLVLNDHNDLDVEVGGDCSAEGVHNKFGDRDITPTSHTCSSRNADSSSMLEPSEPIPLDKTPTQDKPRLRKRKSSLSLGSSPVSSIRSPARSASNALQVQMHLSSPGGRTRTSSVSGGAGKVYGIGLGNVATQATSLVGRMRSGSVGGTANRKLRQVSRRLASIAIPAPPTPPPSAPLPAIPTSPSSARCPGRSLTAPVDRFFMAEGPASPSSPTLGWDAFRVPLADRMPISTSSPTGPAAKGRERALSLSAEMKVDEEMKEN